MLITPNSSVLPPELLRLIPRSLALQMTGINWTDFTANRWIGCTEMPASKGARSGCKICYAAKFAGTRLGVPWGAGAPRREVIGFAAKARRLDRMAKETGMPFSVFSLSLGDWLDAEVDSAWRSEMIDIVEECSHLTWLLLTHRPHLIGKLAPASWRENLPTHIWPGTTVDHRGHARRWDELAEWWGDSGRGWISAEPLASSLAGLEFAGAKSIILGGASNTNDPDWALDPKWVEEMIEEHPDTLYFKQWGVFRDGKHMDKKVAGRDIDGVEFDRTPWPRHRAVLEAAQMSRLAA